MSTTYPVRVDADLDPRLSRWLWLFKWLLVLPHYFVLAFLWLAFAVLSVVAFFGILFTGSYPRSIFEFNVGVLRWSWRVAYYAYAALGTDRYPPFTLHDVPDYPAHLEVEYPEHLSRGLVLVKWWLLAIPHYIVVGLLVGGSGYAVRAGNDEPVWWGAGLIGLLVLVAGVTLMFSGRYPPQLFDLVLGLNRWVLRVAGYAGLMTDRYPPFSLDQGGHEVGGISGETTIVPPPPPPPPPPLAPPTQPGAPIGPSAWTAGRVVSLVLGTLLLIVSAALGLPAGALTAADLAARDDAGFLTSGPQRIATTTYAVVSGNVDLQLDGPPAFTPRSLIGTTRLTAQPRGDKDVFLGIAPTALARPYLNGMERAVLTDIDNGNPALSERGDAVPALPPASADIWTAQSSGSGPQSIVWEPQNGNWTVVVMNADASRGISVDAKVGAEVPALGWVIGLLSTLAFVALLGAVLLIALPLRAVSRQNARSW